LDFTYTKANGENAVPDKQKQVEPGIPTDPGEINKIIKRARQGDATALPMLRRLFKEDKEFVDLLGGDLARQVEFSLINAVCGENLPIKEALMRKLNLLRGELAGPMPTPLERLLVERIALCWLSLHDAELRFAQMPELNIRHAEYWQNRIDRAHRRYLSAIKTLATVRKLALPALQVNIARKQVNVAGAAAPGD
jgi:hypothetical protein